MIHDLKCWPEYFQAVKSGIKPFEYRKDDRGYAVGDILHLREYDPATFQYSGDEIDKTVTYVLPVVTYGAGNDERYVIMGLASRPDWTPCAEGLPDDSNPYLVTIRPSNFRDYCDMCRHYNGEWHRADGHVYKNGVIAWQPLPAPYNPDRKEDAKRQE